MNSDSLSTPLLLNPSFGAALDGTHSCKNLTVVQLQCPWFVLQQCQICGHSARLGLAPGAVTPGSSVVALLYFWIA